MPIKYMTVEEALEKGYEIIEPEPIRRTAPPTSLETFNMIALEVIPALGGGIILGPKGGAVGAAVGNTFSQWYRQSIGLQDEFSGKELTTATLAGSVPVGKFANLGTVARVGVRAGEGVAIALAEAQARVGWQTGEWLTEEERNMTILFGGVFGGGLGAVESRFVNRMTGAKTTPKDSRTEVVKKIDDAKKEWGDDWQDEFTEITGDTGERVLRDLEGQVKSVGDETIAAVANKKLNGEQLDFNEQLLDDSLNQAPPKSTDSMGLSPHDKSKFLPEERVEYDALLKKREDLARRDNSIYEEPLPADFTLPKGLRGEKSMFRDRRPVFESDIDRALWIVRNRENKSGSDYKYMAWLKKHYPHAADNTIRGWGDEVHAKIAPLAKAGGDVEFIVPKTHVAAGREAIIRHDQSTALKPLIDKVDDRLIELSAKARKPNPKLDEAAQDSQPDWTPFEGGEYVHKDGWVIKSLQRDDGMTEFELFRKIEDRLESRGVHSTLRDAKAAQKVAAPKTGTPKQKAEAGYPWFDTPVVKYYRKYYPKLEDGSPDTSQAPISKLRVKGRDVLITKKKYGDYGEVWHRYGDLPPSADMFAPPTLHEKTRTALLKKLRRLADRDDLFNQGYSALFVGGVTLGGVTFGWMSEEEESAMKRAGFGPLVMFALLAGLAGPSVMRFLRTNMGKYFKNNPEAKAKALANEPQNFRDDGTHTGDTRIDEQIKAAAENSGQFNSEGVPIKDAPWWRDRGKDIAQTAGDVLQPMSRTLKKLGAGGKLALGVIKDYEWAIRKTIQGYLGKMEFVTVMEVAIRNGGNKEHWYHWKIATRNMSHRLPTDPDAPVIPPQTVKEADNMLRLLMDRYNGDVLGLMNKRGKGKSGKGAVALYEEFKLAMKEIREYAVKEGGLPLARLENYFPSSIKNWKDFREYMSEHRGWKELENEIEVEFAKHAKKNKEALSPEDKASIASGVLRKESGGMATATSSLKKRILESVDRDLIDAYVDPAAVVESYVRRMVNAVEMRKLLGVDPGKPQGHPRTNPELGLKPVEGVEGAMAEFDPRVGGDISLTEIGLRTDMEGAIGWRVAEWAKKYGIDDDDIDKVRRIIEARFNAVGHSQLFHDAKNVTYIATLGNFGAAITQLADSAYSMHFSGMDNTFRAMFHRRDWHKSIGLESVDIDLPSSRDGLSKVLNFFLKWTGFAKLDKFGKNVVMEAAFLRMRKMAKDNPKALQKELAEIHGEEGARAIRKDLLSEDPFTDEVEKAVWSKLLDVQPAAEIEMPLSHAMAPTYGGMKHVVGASYWLKSFTLKQFDVYREAGASQIRQGIGKYRAGEREEGVAMAREGMVKLVALGATFGAMNAGTSVIKDAMYGRKPELSKEYLSDLSLDAFWRLMGINRYHTWRARREGVPKTTLEFLMPPTTAFDRVSKDLWALTQGEAPVEVYRGIAVGDFYYWHHGGGREKTRKDLAKRYGVKLSNIPE